MFTVIEMSPLDPTKEYSTDLDLSVYDDLRVYAEEGVGSLASSLSSLATGKLYVTSFCNNLFQCNLVTTGNRKNCL